MRLLIDTLVLIARTEGRVAQLGRHISGLVDEDNKEIFVSAASLWEIAIKVRVGKLESSVPVEDLVAYVEKVGMILLPITPLHAVFRVLPEPATRDPFDRMLLAQCGCDGLRLVTIDRALVDHPLSVTTG